MLQCIFTLVGKRDYFYSAGISRRFRGSYMSFCGKTRGTSWRAAITSPQLSMSGGRLLSDYGLMFAWCTGCLQRAFFLGQVRSVPCQCTLHLPKKVLRGQICQLPNMCHNLWSIGSNAVKPSARMSSVMLVANLRVLLCTISCCVFIRLRMVMAELLDLCATRLELCVVCRGIRLRPMSTRFLLGSCGRLKRRRFVRPLRSCTIRRNNQVPTVPGFSLGCFAVIKPDKSLYSCFH